eukprot:gene135-311_t
MEVMISGSPKLKMQTHQAAADPGTRLSTIGSSSSSTAATPPWAVMTTASTIPPHLQVLVQEVSLLLLSALGLLVRRPTAAGI